MPDSPQETPKMGVMLRTLIAEHRELIEPPNGLALGAESELAALLAEREKDKAEIRRLECVGPDHAGTLGRLSIAFHELDMARAENAALRQRAESELAALEAAEQELKGERDDNSRLMEELSSLEDRHDAANRRLVELGGSLFGLVTESLAVLVNVRQYLDAARAEERHARTWSEWDEQMWESAVELTRRMDEAVNNIAARADAPTPEAP